MSAAARRGTCPASKLMCARGRTSLFALIVLLGAQCGRRAEDGARACSLALAFTCALGRTSRSTTETTRELSPPETHEATPRRIRGWVDEWGLLEGAGSWEERGEGGGGQLGGRDNSCWTFCEGEMEYGDRAISGPRHARRGRG